MSRLSWRARSMVCLALAGAVPAGMTISAGAIARAADTIVITPTAEAWYQPDPTCDTPLGCAPDGVLPAASPYPAGTMHVAVSAGQETARSYIAFPLGGLEGTVTGGSLTVELDTAPLNGDQASADADVQVCLTSAPITPAQGSFAPPPAVDCSTSAPATYVATPDPHLEADLGPLLTALPLATGIVLLPDAASLEPSDAWHVVFSAHDRAAADTTAPATLTLTVADGSEAPSEPVQPGFDPPLFGAIEPPAGTGFAGPPLDLPNPRPASPASPPTAAPAPTMAAQTAASVGGYPYPVVWMLPLVLLVLAAAVARALTQELRA